MPRLIDADTVVTILLYDDMSETWTPSKMTITEAIDRWSDEGCPPTVDAEPVVRCKDCKHYNDEWGNKWCGITMARIEDGNEYCSSGDKEEE